MTDVPTPPPPPPGGSEPWSAASGSTPAPPPNVPPPMAPPGGPQPYAPASAHQYADFGKRFVGGLIDYGAPGVVVLVLSMLSDALAVIGGLAGFGWWLYNAYLNGSTGQSIGKKQAGIRLVKDADGTLIGGGLGIVRAIAHIADNVICYIGYLFPLWDAKRQTLADKIMGTVVVVADGSDPGGAAFRGV